MIDDRQILQGDCRDVLKTLPEKSVDCCITSPPYYGLRDYGNSKQIGLEETPNEYIEELVQVFRQVRRVLKDDGTLWLNRRYIGIELNEEYIKISRKRTNNVQPQLF